MSTLNASCLLLIRPTLKSCNIYNKHNSSLVAAMPIIFKFKHLNDNFHHHFLILNKTYYNTSNKTNTWKCHQKSNNLSQFIYPLYLIYYCIKKKFKICIDIKARSVKTFTNKTPAVVMVIYLLFI